MPEVREEDVNSGCDVDGEVMTVSDAGLLASEVIAVEAAGMGKPPEEDSGEEGVAEFGALGEDGVCRPELVKVPVPKRTLC